MIDTIWRIIQKLPPEGYTLLGKFIETLWASVEGGDTETAMLELERSAKAMAAKRAIRL